MGLWLDRATVKERSRWREYVDAFRSMPSVSTPDLIEAVRSDEILGESFPEITPESLKKWIERWEYGREEEREG